MEEVFEIFNEQNERIGTAPRSEVHKKGLIHRASNVCLINSQGQIFLQKRSANKDTCPGYWEMVGEHLKPGEGFREAAVRGLKEELGVTNAIVAQIRGPKLLEFSYHDKKLDREINVLFVAHSDETPVIDPEEVAEGGFFTQQEIEKMIKEGSKKFTSFFLAEWEELLRLKESL